ncbi:hypothetical protein UFOVP961_99 [uncultured Caudovirales phage]|uniref:Uncharacterized protein n=1 Tax=uncultured Caudovirales phage TaxID=2100421 RepID=A0A6J5PVS3_9CAUD|nr:hypothetical protein UFOVP961_99 [uncultured Caudovirales phage]CAB4185172.1 hypothetical protein UFOVP1123_27 [uncultured Caudovirales phage]CAB4193650.1 hypothetical protein UFOVP1239_123 [uncultured Caudovirales phage]CAB4215856.1 hypothetical protein UFOVP1484_31 [uncultured Caudovirales phage]CAB5230643.1 hypothetical protein UFOVP1577_37 [uncultured Caudovirales phage]
MSYFSNNTQPLKKYKTTPSKRDLPNWPFAEYSDCPQIELPTLAEQQQIQTQNSWMLPQMLAYFGHFVVKRNDPDANGLRLIDPLATLEHNIGRDPYRMGLWKVACRLNRSSLVKAQSREPTYSALVPLILAGIKKYQDIPYKHWSTKNLEYIVARDLAEAMSVESIPSLTSAELLEIQATGLEYKSGPKAGTSRSPTGTWTLYNISNTPLGMLPKLATTMLTQIWVAHPSLRNSYMVLHPIEWDTMPEPLINVEPLAAKWSAEGSVNTSPGGNVGNVGNVGNFGNLGSRWDV